MIHSGIYGPFGSHIIWHKVTISSSDDTFGYTQIEITVSYSDSTFEYIQLFSVSASKVFADRKPKHAHERYRIYNMV